MSASRIRRLVSGVHMGLGHDGLRLLLAKAVSKGGANTDVTSLQDGDLIMVLNTKGDKLKVIGCKGLVIGYLKMRKGERIMKDALQYLPATFGGNTFDYDAACKLVLEERLGHTKSNAGSLNTARAKKSAGV